jgi:phospholipid/cholesterol/gamma-HCH transport system permease protein
LSYCARWAAGDFETGSEENNFDRKLAGFYAAGVRGNLAKAFELTNTQVLRSAALPKSYTDLLGRKLFLALLTVQGLGAFALITLGVILQKNTTAKNVIRPRIRQEIARAGVALLPMFFFVALALGFLVIGQTVSTLAKVGAISYLGSTMVIVVVRELGPLLAAFLVLARVGTANVIELGTARALGEVEALEALGIDPVHYLIVPRVIGMAAGIFSLTVYLIIGALASGYLFAFLQDVPLTPGDYFKQIVESLGWLDFALLALKTVAFGFFIAIVTCYHGLAQPLRLEEVSRVAVRAVTQGIIVCVLIDAVFIVLYLVT